jgi:hypothetical protein
MAIAPTGAIKREATINCCQLGRSYTYDNEGESEDADKNCYRESTDVYLQLPQPLVSVTNKTQQFVRLKPLKKASRNCFKKLYIKTT